MADDNKKKENYYSLLGKLKIKEGRLYKESLELYMDYCNKFNEEERKIIEKFRQDFDDGKKDFITIFENIKDVKSKEVINRYIQWSDNLPNKGKEGYSCLGNLKIDDKGLSKETLELYLVDYCNRFSEEERKIIEKFRKDFDEGEDIMTILNNIKDTKGTEVIKKYLEWTNVLNKKKYSLFGNLDIVKGDDSTQTALQSQKNNLELYIDYCERFCEEERKIIEKFRQGLDDNKDIDTILKDKTNDYEKKVVMEYLEWLDTVPPKISWRRYHLTKFFSCKKRKDDKQSKEKSIKPEYIEGDSDIKRYINDRWLDQRNYFDRKANESQKNYRYIQKWLIALGALSTLVISLHFNGILTLFPTQEEKQQQELYDNYKNCYNKLTVMRPNLGKDTAIFDSLPNPFLIADMEADGLFDHYTKCYVMLQKKINKDITFFINLPTPKEKQEQKSLNYNYEKCYNMVCCKRTYLDNDDINILGELPDLSNNTDTLVSDTIYQLYQKCYQILHKCIQKDSTAFTKFCAPKDIANIGKNWKFVQDLDIEKGLCAIISFIIVLLTGFNRLMKHYEEWHRNRENCEKLNRELYNFHYNVGVYQIQEKDTELAKKKKESKFVDRVETIINDYVRDMLSEKDKITPQQIKEIIDEYNRTGQGQEDKDKQDKEQDKEQDKDKQDKDKQDKDKQDKDKQDKDKQDKDKQDKETGQGNRTRTNR